MPSHNGSDLTTFYENVKENGHMHTRDLAVRWSNAVLWTLALNLDRGTKKKLAKALPPELADDLTRPFWLLHFRDPRLTRHDFLKAIARRSGHSDPQFAHFPTMAVFHELKRLAGNDVSQKVADTLAPEIREMWEKA